MRMGDLIPGESRLTQLVPSDIVRGHLATSLIGAPVRPLAVDWPFFCCGVLTPSKRSPQYVTPDLRSAWAGNLLIRTVRT